MVRDEIQPKGVMISTALRAVMIYQAYGLDKKVVSIELHSKGQFYLPTEKTETAD